MCSSSTGNVISKREGVEINKWGQCLSITMNVRQSFSLSVIFLFFYQGFFFLFSSFSRKSAVHGSFEFSPEFMACTENAPSRYAYAYVIWRIDSNDHVKYAKYLANILVAAKLFRRLGMRHDILLLVKMRENAPNHQSGPNFLRPTNSSLKLRLNEENDLKRLCVNVVYTNGLIGDHKNPYIGMMNKFVLWNLTQYQRILFFDGDAIPLFNMDYLLELSDVGIFHPTVVMSGPNEPAQGGLFVLQPSVEAFEQLNEIIKRWNLWMFNATSGWGHKFGDISAFSKIQDNWETNNKVGHDWTFYGANADQGLLYYFSKYVQGKMTQILARKIVNFDFEPALKVLDITRQWKVERSTQGPFAQFINKTRYPFVANNCKRWTRNYCVPPYSDHAHFTMSDKPWSCEHNLKQVRLMMETATSSNASEIAFAAPTTAVEMWWQILFELYKDGINISYYIPEAQRYTDQKLLFPFTPDSVWRPYHEVVL